MTIKMMETSHKAGKTSVYRLIKAAQRVYDLWGGGPDEPEFIELGKALENFKRP